MDIRTGLGYDIHRLTDKEGKPLPLAGIRIDGVRVIAHSDGDCLYHSLSNAILSSLGLEDIGTYFPDYEKETADMNSEEILRFAFNKMEEMDFTLSNVVVTIILEKPKLKSYKSLIKAKLSKLLKIEEDHIAVHANTKEGLDAVGKGEAITVLSQVCIIKM